MDSINSIIKGCLKHDKKSQKDLFEMYYSQMMLVSMRYTSDKDSASEILQESFLKVFKRLNSFNFEGSFEGWVRRIVVNTAIDKIRKDKKVVFLDDLSVTENSSAFAVQAEEFEFETSKVEHNKILKMIQELPTSYRTVFNMRVFEEMTHKDISKELGIVEGTSKSNYHKAKLILQKRILEL